jgi:hypothetical protein
VAAFPFSRRVIPAKAGIQRHRDHTWIAAFAAVTVAPTMPLASRQAVYRVLLN